MDIEYDYDYSSYSSNQNNLEKVGASKTSTFVILKLDENPASFEELSPFEATLQAALGNMRVRTEASSLWRKIPTGSWQLVSSRKGKG